MELADYDGHGIVNLMSTVVTALGGAPTGYPPCALLPPERLGQARHVVLLVVDGLGYAYLAGTGPGSALAHWLVGDISSVVPPTTAAAIPVFLTGQAPAVHGFTGWFTWLRELGCIAAVLPFVTRHGGIPLEPGGVGPLALCGASPLFRALPVASHVVSPRHIAFSLFNRSFGAGASIHGYEGAEGLFQCVGEILAAASTPSYVYAYWHGLDALAHQYGIASSQVRRHFRELDAAFGAFVAAIAGTGTALLVTADHGFVDCPSERQIHLADHPGLEACLTLPLCGEPRFAYCYVHPARSARLESYVARHLSHAMELWPSEALLEQQLFGPGPAHPALAERVGDYVMVMKENYVIEDRLAGEQPFRHVGVHGGLSPAELRVPLVFVPP